MSQTTPPRSRPHSPTDPTPIRVNGKSPARSQAPLGEKILLPALDLPPRTPRLAAISPPRRRSPKVPAASKRPVGTVSLPETGSPRPESPTVPVRPSRPDYISMSPSEQQEMKTTFRSKFGILRSSFPSWKIEEPAPEVSLDEMHDLYETYVKQIIISINSNQWKVYLVVMFLLFEIICIKVLGIDCKGFTVSQVRIMDRFDRLLIELGEKYYVQGGSNWPVEARIVLMAGFNCLVFVAVKYLSRWLGGEGMASTIQGVIDQFVGNSFGSSETQPRDEHGLPSVPTDTSAGLGSLLGQLSGGGSGGGFDLSGMIAQLGGALTQSLKVKDGSEASKPTEAKKTRATLPVYTD